VRPFNADGHDFICQAADSVLAASQSGEHVVVKPPKVSRKADKSGPDAAQPPPPPVLKYVPPTISHFVMNLPASALEFLHNFRGLYEGKENLFEPHTETLLPMIHCHCFAAKLDNDEPVQEVVGRIEREIGVAIRSGDGQKEGELTLVEVRDVAPNKRMFCATFRLPKEVAFAARVRS
jgi:tRNA (guanine37-N1)-methyltransferase